MVNGILSLSASFLTITNCPGSQDFATLFASTTISKMFAVSSLACKIWYMFSSIPKRLCFIPAAACRTCSCLFPSGASVMHHPAVSSPAEPDSTAPDPMDLCSMEGISCSSRLLHGSSPSCICSGCIAL